MKNKWKKIGLIFIILLAALLFAAVLFLWGAWLGYPTIGQKITIWLQAMLLLFGLLLTPIIITNSRKIWAKDKAKRESLNPIEPKKSEKSLPFPEFLDIKKQCRDRSGLFWRYKIRKCLVLGSSSEVQQLLPNFLVLGSSSEVQQLLPNLPTELWQLCDNTLMVYGGV